MEIYRRFAHTHTELTPYLLSAGTEAYAEQISVMFPLAPKTEFMPSSFDFLLWKDIFVAPFTSTGTVRHDIVFPTTANAGGGDSSSSDGTTHWVWWFDESVAYKGGDKVSQFECSLDKFPVFKRAGSIIPLQVTSNYAGHGDQRSKNFKTILISHPHVYNTVVKKQVYEYKTLGYEVSYELVKQEQEELHISVSAQEAPLMILVRGVRQTTTTGSQSIQMAQAVEKVTALVPQALSHDMLMEQNKITSFHVEQIGPEQVNLWIRVPVGAENGVRLVVSNIKGAAF